MVPSADSIHMAGHRIGEIIAKVDVVVEAGAVQVEMTIEVAIDMEPEEVEVAVVQMETARTGLK